MQEYNTNTIKWQLGSLHTKLKLYDMINILANKIFGEIYKNLFLIYYRNEDESKHIIIIIFIIIRSDRAKVNYI